LPHTSRINSDWQKNVHAQQSVSGQCQPSKIKAKATMSKTDSNANTTDSVSSRIRYRLQNAGVRFHANDNIADFIEAMNWTCCNRKWQKKCRGAGKPGD
jgi:hypothetical protein